MQEDRRRRGRILVFVEELGLVVLCVFSASNCALVLLLSCLGSSNAPVFSRCPWTFQLRIIFYSSRSFSLALVRTQQFLCCVLVFLFCVHSFVALRILLHIFFPDSSSSFPYTKNANSFTCRSSRSSFPELRYPRCHIKRRIPTTTTTHSLLL